MDKIFIEDLQIDTVIGIYDWERQIRQVISLDIEMGRDISRAAATDAIEDTLNYKEVAKRLIAYVQNSRFELIESLVERIAEIILYEFDIARVKVKLSKPGAVRYSRNVGVEIVRERQTAGSGRDIYIGIGSNVNPGTNIRSGLAMLENELGETKASTIYRNPAVGFEGDDFYNLVVQARTSLPPAAVNRCLGLIEALHGRDRSAPKFAARTLDLDLLLYGDLVTEGGLKLPRADITRYAFVLKPLAELAPGLIHPKEGRTMRQLWEDFQGEHAMTAVKLEEVGL